MSIYISSSLVATPGVVDYPLTHARIGYETIINFDTVTGTAGLVNYPLSNIYNPATFEEYRPDGTTATIDIFTNSEVDCDYMAMQQKGVTGVEIYYSNDGVAYTLLQDYNTGDQNGADMALFQLTTAPYWRIIMTGSNIAIIAMKLGKALAMSRPIYGGHSPITLNRVTATRPNMSESGQYLGTSVQRKGLKGSFDWGNLKADWYRQYFDKFAEYNPNANPFFIAWRPISFPKEVAYCWATNDISPSNTGTKDFMSVSLSVEGFASAS